MKLTFEIVGASTETHEVDKNTVIIGRSKEADVTLGVEGLSRKHLQIDLEGDQLYVTDLNSSNGVYVNEERIEAGTKVEYHTFLPLKICGTTTISIEI